ASRFSLKAPHAKAAKYAKERQVSHRAHKGHRGKANSPFSIRPSPFFIVHRLRRLTPIKNRRDPACRSDLRSLFASVQKVGYSPVFVVIDVECRFFRSIQRS